MPTIWSAAATPPSASPWLALLRAFVALCLGTQFAAGLVGQATWVGTTSTNWNTAANWSTNAVPTTATDVIIPAVTAPAFAPATVSGTPACRNLTIQTGGVLTLTPLVILAVHGNLDVDGTAANSGSIELRGTAAATVDGNSPLPTLAIDKGAGVGITIVNGVTIGGAFTMRQGVLTAAGTVNVSLPASFLGGSLSNSGSWTFASNVAFTGTQVTAAPPLRVLGNWTSDASFQPTAGTVTFAGTTTLAGSPSFFNVTVDIGAGTTNTVNAAVASTVRGSLNVRGNARWNGDQPLAVDVDLDVDLGGTFDTKANTHSVGRSVIVDGQVLGTGGFRCVGAAAATVTASQPLRSLVCQKTGTSVLTLAGSSVVVQGALTLVSGVLTVSSTTRVAGDSTFQGGSLTGTGLLDLDGNASFVGASVTLPPSITCSGNWTADSFYDPASGTVTFDGTPGSSQTIVISPASFGTQATFSTVNIAAGASVTANSPIRVRSAMTVSGQFVANAPMDHDGSFTVAAAAVFNANAFQHTFAGSVSLQTTIQVAGTGRFVFDGSQTASMSAGGTNVRIPNVRVEKTGGATLNFGGTFQIDGALELVSGRLDGPGGVVTVTGDATFLGGHLGSPQPTLQLTLVVRGNFVSSGAVAVYPPNIAFAGNWTADDLFAPAGGTVTANGNAPKVLNAPTGTLKFSSFGVAFGASISTQQRLECSSLNVEGLLQTTGVLASSGAVTVGAQGTLNAGAATHQIGGSFNSSGNFVATGTLVFHGPANASVAVDDPLPRVRVAKTANALLTMQNSVVNGDLDLDTGILSTSVVFGMTVNGTARLNGGMVQSWNATVVGDVVCAGTQAEISGTNNSIINLNCQGNFTGHVAFRPILGTINIVGANRILSGVLELASLGVPVNSTVQATSPVVLVGNLAVNGIFNLRTPNQPLTVHGTTTLGTGAQLQIGNHAYRFGGTLSATDGAIVRNTGSSMEFFGATNATFSHNAQAPLPPVVVNKGALASLTTSGGIDIDGNLTLTSGALVVASATRVRGNASFAFGSLVGQLGSTLSVDGSVAFTGATALTPPNIVVKGGWTANSLFRPTSGTVTFAGAGTTQPVSGAEARFFGLALSVSANVVSSAPLRVDGSVTVSSAFLTANHPSDFVVAGSVSTTGSLTVAGKLRVTGNLTGSGSIVVGGQLEVTGDTSLPSGTMSIAGGRFGGSLLADGGFTSSAAVLFDGDQAETLRSAAPLPSIQIARAAGSSLVLATGLQVNGTLLLSEGDINVVGSVAVSGDALFVGGLLQGTGTMTVDGDVTFGGSLAFAPPNLVVRGDFTPSFEFQPLSGTVTLDSNQPQAILGTTARFHGLTIATFSSVTTAANLFLAGPCAVQGLLTTTGAVDCDGSFTVNNGWNAGAGTHRFAGNVSIQGSLLATGLFVLDGSSNFATFTSTQPVPALSIDRDQQVQLNNVVVAGDLTLVSGRLLVAGTVVVGDDVVLSAGELATSGGNGLLQVVDSFSSTGAFVANPPAIQVGGAWTADAAFNPASGSVAFVGTGSQSLASTSGPLQFFAVQVANGATVTTTAPMTLRNSLTVNGTLVTSASLDVDAAVATNTESVLTLGAATHRFAGNVSIGGVLTATGAFEFDNEGSVTVVSAVPIPTVRKTGVGALTLNTGLVIAGNLEADRGTLGYGTPVTVQGSAIFRGGDLAAGTSARLDVLGSVSFLGATATNPGVISCAGNWASVANFTPPSGRVELVGTGTITSLTPNVAASFFLLDVLSGQRTVTGAIAIRGTSMLVQSQATLRVATGGRLSVERAAITVNGSLEVTGTGELLLGDLASVAIQQIGSCRLIGAGSTLPARVAGLDGGNYSFVVQGFLAARDFEFLQPDANGLDIRATATIDATPAAGFRNGTFDFPRNEPGACLLRIEPPTSPPVALTLQNIRFQNTQGVQNVFNAKVPVTGQAISFLNATGSFAGASFESDPQGIVSWTSGQLTVLGGFQVVAGLNSATVTWTTADESAVNSFTLDRQIVSPTPTPFGNPLVFSSSGAPTTRQQVITGLVPGITYRVRLQERGVPAGPLTTIATADVVPFGSLTVAQIFEVGGTGFATIQQGVNAAIASGQAAPIVRIRPGTYPSFSVNGAPSRGLRITGDGSGPVVITTAAATPVTIQNVPIGRYVELADLTIGTPASPVTGVLVNACTGLVVLDEVSVQAGAANAVVVQGSTAFVMQGPNTAVQSLAGRGVVLDASVGTISNSTLSSLRLQNNSQVTHAALSVAPELLSGSTAVGFAGRMPSLRVNRYPLLSQPLQFLFEGFPNSVWLLVMSDNYFVPLNVFQMPILVDLSTMTTLTNAVTDVAGVSTYSTYLPPNGALIGATQVFQAAALDLLAGTFRLSDAAAVTVVASN